ncbi:hypothetical protein [Microcoleus sp. herbarium12]|uniref:hypothetical protein n=1 Tax=Microcoleus sp. herbarium12 TaxID=3055437 RepID=UPI002FD21B1E
MTEGRFFARFSAKVQVYAFNQRLRPIDLLLRSPARRGEAIATSVFGRDLHPSLNQQARNLKNSEIPKIPIPI